MCVNLENSVRKLKFKTRNLRPLQSCTFAHYDLDLHAIVFFFQILFFSREITRRCANEKRCNKIIKSNVIFIIQFLVILCLGSGQVKISDFSKTQNF